jgi:hypothetical protein
MKRAAKHPPGSHEAVRSLKARAAASIRRARLAAERSQRDVAIAAGITERAVRSAERAEGALDTQARVAKVLGLSALEMVGAR